MNIMSFDPGTSGHIEMIDALNYLINDWPMPYKDGVVDVGFLQSLLIEYRPDFVAVERQNGQNMKANTNLGRITATLDLCGIKNWHMYEPRAWLAYWGLGGDKSEHIKKCIDLGYNVPPALTKGGKQSKTKLSDGFADALLLALAARVLPPF